MLPKREPFPVPLLGPDLHFLKGILKDSRLLFLLAKKVLFKSTFIASFLCKTESEQKKQALNGRPGWELVHF